MILTKYTFKMERFPKRIMPEWRCGTRIFSEQRGGERFVELGHFDKDFVKNTRKRSHTGNYFRVSSPRYS